MCHISKDRVLSLRFVIASVRPVPSAARSRVPPLLALVVGLSASCDAGKRVSPWGGAGPKLAAYVERPDLVAHLDRIDQETAALGLVTTLDLTVEDERGETYALRSFEGRDSMGARTTATRIATGHGVVVAVGPKRETDADTPTELVRAFGGPGGAIGFPRDANDDGSLEVMLRSRRGELLLLSLAPRGSRTIAVASPAHGAELDERGNLRFVREIGCVRGTSATSTIVVLSGPCEPAQQGVLTRALAVPLSYAGDRFDRSATTESAWHAARAAGVESEIAGAAGFARDVLQLEADYHRSMRGDPMDVAADRSAAATRLDEASKALRELVDGARLKVRGRGPSEARGDGPSPPR